MTKLQMDIEPYFTSLNSLARFVATKIIVVESGFYIIDRIIFQAFPAFTRLTVGTAENINVEGKFEGKREFDSQPTFPEELPHTVHHDTRRLESPKSSLEDDSKTIFDFNSKTSSSIDSIKCEYIY